MVEHYTTHIKQNGYKVIIVATSREEPLLTRKYLDRTGAPKPKIINVPMAVGALHTKVGVRLFQLARYYTYSVCSIIFLITIRKIFDRPQSNFSEGSFKQEVEMNSNTFTISIVLAVLGEIEEFPFKIIHTGVIFINR